MESPFQFTAPGAGTWNDFKQTLGGGQRYQNLEVVISKDRQVVWTLLILNCRTVFERSSAVNYARKEDSARRTLTLLYGRLVGFASNVLHRLSEHAPCEVWNVENVNSPIVQFRTTMRQFWRPTNEKIISCLAPFPSGTKIVRRQEESGKIAKEANSVAKSNHWRIPNRVWKKSWCWFKKKS